MIVPLFLIGFGLWIILGMVVVEACRIWRTWWIGPFDPWAVVIWPVVLFYSIKIGGDNDR